MRTGAIRQKLPSIVRYLSKLVLDGLPAAAGWVMFVFDPSIFGTITDPTDSDAVQAWMGVKYYWGTYSTELEAAVLGNFWCFSNNFLPNLNTYNGSITPMANTYVPQ